jgi:hypothetical protein
MRITLGSSQSVEIVSARDPLVDSFEETLPPGDLEWYVRGCARDSSAVWQLRELIGPSGSTRGGLTDAQVIDEAARQVKAGSLVGRFVDAPRISRYALLSGGPSAYAAPGALPVGPPPRLTDKCNLAAYCEEQFRLAASEGIARVDCPVLNGGQCPS